MLPARDSQLAGPIALTGVALLTVASIASLHTQSWDWLIAAAILAVLLALIAAAVEFVARLVHPQRPSWQCPHCRYDRRGLPQRQPCPECGRDP